MPYLSKRRAHGDERMSIRFVLIDQEVEMLKKQVFPIASIRVPVKRARTLDAGKVGQIAESILEEGQTTPIQVRADGDRFVLVEGLHRLEALKALGEKTIDGYLVQARKH
jgi:sulfiredoxin